MRRFIRFFLSLAVFGLLFGVIGLGILVLAFWNFSRDLPDYQQLAEYAPPITTRIHAGNGQLMAEYAHERRLYVPIDAIPELVAQAFIAAEDQHFYSHPGVDYMGILRAALTNAENLGQNRRPVGASTITQQVAKNFLLTNEVSFARKIKEVILAYRMERAFTKEHILELYLNEIYLGVGSYGVAAAALKYFDKQMGDLEIEEVAYLAALPKAPNNYHPQRHPQAARIRRDYVIDRMAEDGYITAEQAEAAKKKPLRAHERRETPTLRADWYAEEVRRELLARFGEKTLYEGGLSVRTSMDPKLQALAERSLRRGLIAYDRRHGFRKPLGEIDLTPGWDEKLKNFPHPAGMPETWTLALVTKTQDTHADIVLADGSQGQLPLSELSWARQPQKDQKLGPPIRSAREVLKPGDVILVEATANKDQYGLRQIPEIGGAVVAMDPHTGRVRALAGGWDFWQSQFNRATQALRQPGSSFKPFVYMAAFDNGFTPSSLVLDAPFVFDPGPGQPKWKPGNYTNDFLGPATLRVGIEKSRNLMTIRLAQSVGMDKVVDYARRFGIQDNLQPYLPMALGAGDTTLIKMTTAYAQIDNGGKRVVPSLIDRVQDRTGKTLFKQDRRPCVACNRTDGAMPRQEAEIPDVREQIIDPGTAYQMTSLLQGVVERGTATRLRELGRPLAGKTGTSNDFYDAWFIGFSPDLVVGVFTGFDTPRTLGDKETGSAVAVPIFKDFMAEALAGQPIIPFRLPPGLRLVRVNPATGQLAQVGERNAIFEAFKPGTEPTGRQQVLDGTGGDDFQTYGASGSTAVTPITGTGGLY